MNSTDIGAYLDRIGLDVPPQPDLSALAVLQASHLMHVPFEGLDVRLGIPLSLDTDALFDKIIRRRRGGYCFELNGLFLELLRGLGFVARPVLARVWYRNPPQIPPLTHTLNLVSLEGEAYLVDVGFGGATARTPVAFRPGAEAEDIDGTHFPL